MTEYKPLTPSFRQDINTTFDNQIKELQACEQNGFVTAQVKALEMAKILINGLPDGYPMPLVDRKCRRR